MWICLEKRHLITLGTGKALRWGTDLVLLHIGSLWICVTSVAASNLSLFLWTWLEKVAHSDETTLSYHPILHQRKWETRSFSLLFCGYGLKAQWSHQLLFPAVESHCFLKWSCDKPIVYHLLNTRRVLDSCNMNASCIGLSRLNAFKSKLYNI